MAFSKVMIIGNLGRDPEMRYTPNGRPVTEFSVAVTHRGRDQQSGEEHRPFGRLRNGCHEFVRIVHDDRRVVSFYFVIAGVNGDLPKPKLQCPVR